MSTYEVTTFDVCQPGYERLRSTSEFILVGYIERRTSKRDLTNQFEADIQACERPVDFDYGAARKAVRSYMAMISMKSARMYAEPGGCNVYLYINVTEN